MTPKSIRFSEKSIVVVIVLNVLGGSLVQGKSI